MTVSAFRLLFAYAPVAETASRLLLAIPPTSGHQTAKIVDEGTPAPSLVLTESSNAIELYELDPGKPLFREYLVSLSDTADSWKTPSIGESHYLRESKLIDFGPTVRKIAIDCQRASPYATANELFQIVVRQSTYHWPPERRGASAFFESWRGDCGQMAFAITAALRFLGIPARPVVGSFAKPGLNGHAWVEFFDGSVWIAIDSALANAHPRNSASWFNFVPSDRIAFSYDCDLCLNDRIRPPNGKTTVDMLIGEEMLNWGGSLLSGCVPYLQPGYPLIDEVMHSALTLPVWEIWPLKTDLVS